MTNPNEARLKEVVRNPTAVQDYRFFDYKGRNSKGKKVISQDNANSEILGNKPP